MIVNGIVVMCSTGCRREATVWVGNLAYCDAHTPAKVTCPTCGRSG